MKNAQAVRERILSATEALIRQSSGSSADITTRAVAARAGVGVGLINYHFQSKDQLITLCVQRMIGQVVSSFSPHARPGATDRERLTDWASEVFEFLFGNAALSRISILGDFAQYAPVGNSAHTQAGFALALQNDVRPSDRALLTFVLTTAMQAAFLGGRAEGARLGFDFDAPEGRRAYITRLVDVLCRGFQPEPEKEPCL